MDRPIVSSHGAFLGVFQFCGLAQQVQQRGVASVRWLAPGNVCTLAEDVEEHTLFAHVHT